MRDCVRACECVCVCVMRFELSHENCAKEALCIITCVVSRAYLSVTYTVTIYRDTCKGRMARRLPVLRDGDLDTCYSLGAKVHVQCDSLTISV